MAEKKKKKEKNSGRKGTDDGADSNKLTKDEDAIARFLRFNCPTNSTMFEGNEVYYFSGKKAIDVLVESKRYGAAAKTPKFLNSEAAEEFLQTLLAKGLFFRAKKLVPKKKEKVSSDQQQKGEKSGRDVSKSPPSGTKKTTEKKQRKEAEEVTERTKTEDKGEEDGPKEEEDEEEDQQEKREANAKDEEKRRKRKVKLLFHDTQTFDVSTSDVYVWVFDPTPLWKKCVGILIVLGTIGGCLFPLWPDWLRLGIYYLSVLGIALFGLLLGVGFARTILFGLIWLFTLGRHRLWLLPNLLEECGFFESFKPAYTYEYVPGGIFAKKEPKNKKKKAAEAKKDSQKNGEEELQQQQKDSESPGKAPESERTPLLESDKHEDVKIDSECVVPPPIPSASLAKGENKTNDATQATDNEQTEDERNCSSRSESESGNSSKKDGTSGSEGEDGEEGAQTGTDDSNSWEKLSENSHRSGECGKKAL